MATLTKGHLTRPAPFTAPHDSAEQFNRQRIALRLQSIAASVLEENLPARIEEDGTVVIYIMDGIDESGVRFSRIRLTADNITEDQIQ